MTVPRPPRLGDPAKVLSVVFGCRPEDVAADVILTPFIPLQGFRRHMTGDTIELAPRFFYKGFTARYADRPVTVIGTGVGPSRVGDCVGFLSLTLARRVLFVGAVGGLAEEHAIGDYFLPTEVADGEGFTAYAETPFAERVRRARRYPSSAFDGTGERFLSARGHRSRLGRVFTIGSIVFEDEANLRRLAAAGFDAVEMELSAFYASARYHGVLAEALTYVSDLPLRRDLWSERTAAETEALRAAYRAAPRLALERLSELPEASAGTDAVP